VDPMTKEVVRKTTDPSIVEWRGLLAFYLSQLDDGRRTDLTVEKMRETGTRTRPTMWAHSPAPGLGCSEPSEEASLAGC
jgi:hypothetical protein